MEIVGRTLLLVIGVGLAAAFPVAELARGMATNPSQHPVSMGALSWSAVGAAMIAAAVLA